MIFILNVVFRFIFIFESQIFRGFSDFWTTSATSHNLTSGHNVFIYSWGFIKASRQTTFNIGSRNVTSLQFLSSCDLHGVCCLSRANTAAFRAAFSSCFQLRKCDIALLFSHPVCVFFFFHFVLRNCGMTSSLTSHCFFSINLKPSLKLAK